MKNQLVRKSLLIFFCVWCVQVQSQDDSLKVELNGYISNMQSVQFEKFSGPWINDNLIHNRINFSWFPTDKLSFKINIRNRLFTGESVKYYPGYAGFIKQAESGWFDLCWNVLDEQSVLLNMNIDRLFFQYEKGKFSATIGRQRINWGKTFVWNPNDIFNAYSFFDFDYAERPGSDAIRLQYYTSEVASIELAAKIDKNEDITAAGIWRFNVWGYDFQLMGGVLNSGDYTLGTGWSGAIGNIDFKGEMSYFHPMDQLTDSVGQFIGSLSLGYTFPTLSILCEFLYTDIQKGGSNSFLDLYTGQLSVKNLSFTRYNILGQMSWQITPLLSGSVSAIYYPDIKGYFIGPSFDYSFTDNLYASLVIQSFNGEIQNPLTLEEQRMKLSYAFFRLKWNF